MTCSSFERTVNRPTLFNNAWLYVLSEKKNRGIGLGPLSFKVAISTWRSFDKMVDNTRIIQKDLMASSFREFPAIWTCMELLLFTEMSVLGLGGDKNERFGWVERCAGVGGGVGELLVGWGRGGGVGGWVNGGVGGPSQNIH